MRIGHYTNTYYPSISGVVRSVSSFRAGQSLLGHNAFVFTQDAGDYKDEEPFIFRYPSLNLGLLYDVPATIPISPFMEKLLPTLKMDLIHSHHPVLLGQVAANKAEELDIPLVFTFHTRYRDYSHYIPLPQESFQKLLKTVIDKWIEDYVRKVDHVVVPSESMRIVLEEQYGYDQPTTVVPTGIDLRPYEKADGKQRRKDLGWNNERVIIAVSRLGSEKNWTSLVKAFALAHIDNPNTRLAIIGDGPEKKRLIKLCRELKVTEKVDFLGKLPFEEIPATLKAADLFIFASTTETQGLVTLEAMAAGLPIVAVDAVGTQDVIDHEQDGLLTDDDPDALAQAITRLLTHEDVFEHFRLASIKKSRSLEYTQQAKKLLAVYERVLEQRKLQPLLPKGSKVR